MNKTPRVACINDLSGYGRCSLTTAIAILSVMGVQPCPVPTAILSKHSGFSDFYFHDFTDSMEPYLQNWKDIEFDGIYTGFLGSLKQIQIVENFIKYTESSNVKVIIDPVMGDLGKVYSTYTKEMCKEMRKLVKYAWVITPNITEACILTDTPYTSEEVSPQLIAELSVKLKNMGARSVVITGIRSGDSIKNYSFGEEIFVDEIPITEATFSGTGDIFSSILCGNLVRGKTLRDGVSAAGAFISEVTKETLKMGKDLSEGVAFEPFLYKLIV